ncbi:MAG TPA: FadR/GntR family transcriptional regulator [Actinomycetales bacterium]|jgi:DNA-binding FadR family transcriptional regulator|nr:FadR/GntR family transcriptional regulator [Actinomycetales bacterium]
MSDAPRGADVDLFRPVNVDRVSQVIVDQIKLLVREGKLAKGDRLPSERALCQRFGVSRVTVREALRVLEASGLIEIRVGARGGAFVTSPTKERLGEGLADLMTLSPLTPGHITEARRVIEVGILPLVVERATERDIADLRRLVDEGYEALDRNAYTMGLSAAFHVGIATCAHNPAIETLVQSFHGPMLLSLRQAQIVAPAMGRRGTAEHAALVDAIENRDVDSAIKVMTAHLDRTAALVRDLGPVADD